MSKGTWTKYQNVNVHKKMLTIIKSKELINTNEIRTKLKEKYNISISWKFASMALEHLLTLGHISKITRQKEKKDYNYWTMKGVENGATVTATN